jgi:glycosyltransferase involved in cell wall biosynthesis
MKGLRVVQIVNGLALNTRMGGAERFGYELARHLDKQRFESIVVGLWEWEPATEQKWRKQLTDEGITSIVGARKDDLNPIANFAQSMARIEAQFDAPVDVIHSQCDFGDVAALWLRRSLRSTAVVRTAHNELEWAKRPFRRWLLVKGIYPFVFDLEFGVSQRVVDILDRRLMARLLGKRAIVMHNAIDTSRFVALSHADIVRQKRDFGIEPNAPLIGSVGRLTRQKGYHHFIEAAKIVAQSIPDAKFLLIGGGEEEDALKQLASSLNLTDRFIFAGARDDIAQILPILDVFVSSSLWEGLPTVIMEAMLATTPVVATQVAGTTELVKDDVTGTLASPANSAELGAAILSVLQQPQKADAMADRARTFVKMHFAIDAVARGQEAYYQQLVSTRPDRTTTN